MEKHMFDKNMIEMMHFPSRLNAGIWSVSFDENSKNKSSGFETLEHYLNESILMTGKYCNKYADENGADNNILRIINHKCRHDNGDVKILIPNYSLEYQKFKKLETVLDCIKITYPQVHLKIESSNSNRMSIERLADMFLKAGIKSKIPAETDEGLSINIFRINTNYKSFYKANYDYHKKPEILKEDFELMISEVRSTNIVGHKFLYFYSDKWDFHFSNFKYDE